MSTFGRGLRAEFKKISGLGASGFNTILSCPSSSNFFIFVVMLDNDNGLGFRRQRSILDTSGTGAFTTTNDTLSSDQEIVEYFSGAQGESLTDSFQTRLLLPNDALQFNGNGSSSYYNVIYQEIYFGGQSDY